MSTEDTKPNGRASMTPNELIHFHLDNRDEPITGEEIRDAKITEEPADTLAKNNSDTSKEIKKEEQQKDDREFPITSPFEVLGD